MMDDEILLPDRQKTIPAIVADAFRIARIIGFELEVRTVETDKFGKFVQSQHSVQDKNFLADHIEFFGHEGAKLFRHQAIEFESR